MRSRGFSLVEVLVTLAVTSVVMGGLVATFTSVTKGIDNTTKKSSQTNTMRGLSELMRKDFAAAGQGVSDLNAYNIRALISEAVSGIDPGDPANDLPPYFYGVADVDYEDVNGRFFSSVTLQWFEYDLATDNRATFFVSDYQWETSGTYTGPVVLSTNSTEHATDLAEGDILVFYKLRVMYEEDAYTEDTGPAIWNAGFETNSKPDNEAIILQVKTVTSGAAGGFDDLSEKVAVTFHDSAIFLNNYGAGNGIQTEIADSDGDLATKLDNIGHPPGYAFIARKLGKENAFRRVSYSVRQMTSGDYVLVRTSNVGTDRYSEIVATDVEEFEIRLGLDVQVGIEPDDVQQADIDGYVQRSDNSSWTMSYVLNPSLPTWPAGITQDEFWISIGRHTLMADVLFTQNVPDKLEGSITRSFRQQFRVNNNVLPMPSL